MACASCIRALAKPEIEVPMVRSDFDPRLSPFLGDLIERRRKLVDVVSQQGGDQDPEAAAPTLVQLAVLQSCICAIAEVIEEARVTAKLDRPMRRRSARLVLGRARQPSQPEGSKERAPS